MSRVTARWGPRAPCTTASHAVRAYYLLIAGILRDNCVASSAQHVQQLRGIRVWRGRGNAAVRVRELRAPRTHNVVSCTRNLYLACVTKSLDSAYKVRSARRACLAGVTSRADARPGRGHRRARGAA